MRSIPEKYRKYFLSNLAKLNAEYDEEWKAPGQMLGAPKYHTKLHNCRVHSTRDAFAYADMLLATGDEKDCLRAIDVLRHDLALQDKNPANATYGIWSWYMEEPLECMDQPDWNWADFCGKHILQVFYYHADRMPQDLLDDMRQTLRNACMSIFRRNMHPGYTNISIMGCYVTLACGQYFGWQDMFEYGMRRLEKAWEFNIKNKSFAEYNSPRYTFELICDLSRIYMQIKDEHIHDLTGDLLDLAWRTVAEHFHAPTHQWTGPNARSYSFLISDDILSFLRIATDDERLIPDDKFVYTNELAYIDCHCPEKYKKAFKVCETHDVNIGFTRADSIEHPRTHIAIAHITPEYTLASWECMDTWNQCRNLTGYWGGSKTRFMGMTILHDLYDFASGMLVTAQRGSNALIVGSIITDGGDTHSSLDMVKDETIGMYDLRMRIELGGMLEKSPVLTDNTVLLEDGAIKLRITLLDSNWDGEECKLELQDNGWDEEQQAANTNLYRRIPKGDKRRYVDVVFYHGEYKKFKLSEVQACYAALCVSMEGETPADVHVLRENGRISASATMAGTRLFACAPLAPCRRGNWRGWAAINGEPMRKTYGLPVWN